MMLKISRFIANFQRETKGSAAIEFAILLPLLLIFLFPVVDYARYILMQQKAIKTSSVLADSISMSVPMDISADPSDFGYNNALLTTDLIQEYANLAFTLMTPFGSSPNAINVTISNIDKNENEPPATSWRYNNQTGFASDLSTIDPGIASSFITNMGDGENLIYVTVSVDFNPFSPNLLAFGVPFLEETQVVSSHLYRSRYGELTTPLGDPSAVEFPCVESAYEICSQGDPQYGYLCYKVPNNCPCPNDTTFYSIDPPSLKECRKNGPCFGLSASECECEEGEVFTNGECCPAGQIFTNGQCEAPVTCGACEYYSSSTNQCYPISNCGGTGTGTGTGTDDPPPPPPCTQCWCDPSLCGPPPPPPCYQCYCNPAYCNPLME